MLSEYDDCPIVDRRVSHRHSPAPDTCPTCGGAVTYPLEYAGSPAIDYDHLAMTAVETLLPGYYDCTSAECSQVSPVSRKAAKCLRPCHALAHALLVDAWTRSRASST